MLSKTSTRILFVALLLVVIFLSPCQSQNSGDIKSIDEKVDSLISIMTLKDKITQIQHRDTKTCIDSINLVFVMNPEF